MPTLQHICNVNISKNLKGNVNHFNLFLDLRFGWPASWTVYQSFLKSHEYSSHHTQMNACATSIKKNQFKEKKENTLFCPSLCGSFLYYLGAQMSLWLTSVVWFFAISAHKKSYQEETQRKRERDRERKREREKEREKKRERENIFLEATTTAEPFLWTGPLKVTSGCSFSDALPLFLGHLVVSMRMLFTSPGHVSGLISIASSPSHPPSHLFQRLRKWSSCRRDMWRLWISPALCQYG